MVADPELVYLPYLPWVLSLSSKKGRKEQSEWIEVTKTATQEEYKVKIEMARQKHKTILQQRNDQIKELSDRLRDDGSKAA